MRRDLRLFRATLIICLASLSPAAPARAFPWSIDMYRGDAIQPFARAPRVMPSDALPVHGEPALSREQATIKLHNPLTSTRENIERGKRLFATNCATCHGDNGTGDGPVAKAGILARPPANLVFGASRSLPDGYIYGTIVNGGIVMPSLGDALSPDERWQVVLYVRSLQSGASAAAKSRR